MKNVIAIIKAHGGLPALKRKAIKIDPPSDGYMRLCIEYIGRGPRGQALVSIAHYYEQEGDVCQDPDVVVEVPDDGWDNGKTWAPISFTQAPGYYSEACYKGEDGQVYIRPAAVRDIKLFLPIWDKNIGEQGYVEAFKPEG